MSKHKWNFNNSYQQLSNKMYSPVMPTKVLAPATVLFNKKLAVELGLVFEAADTEFKDGVFSGNFIPEGAEPIAQAYAGHQFGHFNILGDGRAILLGEIITPNGSRVDIQLKGSGPTPYSRRGDGRATLRSMLREYIISEAMHGMGIASSRSIAVAITGEKVYREDMHDGAVLTRIASSHIRVGTFEYARNFLSTEELESFTNYTIRRHYPQLQGSANAALEFLRAVVLKQVALMVNWMRVGFIHGVMNTDNMSVAGETFDYGPCAFMNSYDTKTVFSSIDTNSRYAYGNQPQVALWNLSCLASALLPLIHSEEAIAIKMAEEVLNVFPALYQQQYATMMANKIGFLVSNEEIVLLISELLEWMQLNKGDYTNTFLVIQWNGKLSQPIYEQDLFKEWLKKREILLAKNGISIEVATSLMQLNNPCYIPRNHLVEQALDAACFENNYDYFNRFLSTLVQPNDVVKEWNEFHMPPEVGDGVYATYCGT
ncbi:MAG: YdiU family protein [Sphingobacteriia bacterium]|nr:MAG: YdiU family protein [Sphingobacteriia bacterium]TAG30453.1 MAG: YdiU family protein [Sphingobacteriia bacterium]TAH09216.1 MAG: YdiU family protein [Sphingobacteriia bacterium]